MNQRATALRLAGTAGALPVKSRTAALFVLSSASAQFLHAALDDELGLGSESQTGYPQPLVALVLGGLITSEPEFGPTALAREGITSWDRHSCLRGEALFGRDRLFAAARDTTA
jgi:hypothetical protein